MEANTTTTTTRRTRKPKSEPSATPETVEAKSMPVEAVEAKSMPVEAVEAKSMPVEATPETVEATPVPEVTTNKKSAETRLVQSVLLADLQDSSVWSQTGQVIWASRQKFDGKKIKEMSAAFADLLDKNVDSTLIPETGESRTGETITLRKKGGAVKWSSWAKTARMVQNCSSIFKGIEVLGFDTCFPNGSLIPRSQLDKLLKEEEAGKAGENPVDTVKRCLEMATKKIPVLESKEDLVSINEYLEALLEVYKEQLENLK